MTHEQQAIFARAQAIGFPRVFFGGSKGVEGPAGWRTIDTLPPADLQQIALGLEARELEYARGARFDQAEAEREARRAEAARPLQPGDPEHAEAQRMFAEAAERARYAASTEGKLDRLIELNERIAAALEKR